MSCDQNIKALLVAWQQNQPIVVDICKYKAEQVNKLKKIKVARRFHNKLTNV